MAARITLQVHVWALVVLSGAILSTTAQAQGAYNGAQTVAPISGLGTPGSIAMDGMGNFFVGDPVCQCIHEIPAGRGAQVDIPITGFTFSGFFAIDAQDDLIIGDLTGSRVVEMPRNATGWGDATVIASDPNLLACPFKVTTDAARDVFVQNTAGSWEETVGCSIANTALTPAIVELPASGTGWGSPVAILTSSMLSDNYSGGADINATADKQGDLFYVTFVGSQFLIYELPRQGSGYGPPTPTPVANDGIVNLAVDNGGNLFYLNYHNQFLEVPLTSGGYSAPTVVASGGNINSSNRFYQQLAVDAADNLYFGLVNMGGVSQVIEFQPDALNFYTQPVGTPGSTVAMNFTLPAGATIGSIAITSFGGPGKDFADAGGSTCKAKTYAAATNCVINLKFNPQAPGVRRGGVAAFDGSGNALGSLRLYGLGVGPQSVFTGTPMTTSPLTPNMANAVRVATDAAGNAFVASFASNPQTQNSGSVIEYPRSGSGFGTPAQILSGINNLNELFLDGAGNLFVLSRNDATHRYSHGALMVFPKNASGFGSPVIIANALSWPMGLLVDPQENIFVASNLDGSIIEWPMKASGGFGSPFSVAGGLTYPNAIARDAAGNLYITLFCSDVTCSPGTGSLVELPLTPSGYAAPVTLASDLSFPAGVAVEANGNLLVSSSGDGGPNGAILEFAYTGSGYTGPVTLAGGLTNSQGVTIDSAGNIIFPDPGKMRLDMLPRGGSPGLTFATTVRGTTSPDSPQTVTVENIGNQPLIFSALSYPPDFPGAGHSTDCTSTGTLSPIQTCTLTANFKPVTAITSGTSLALSESVRLTTNTLNKRGTVQQLSLAGTETPGTITPVLTLTVSKTTPPAKAPITLTATAAGPGGTPTGKVTFFDGSTQMGGSAQLNPKGVATLNVAPPASGSLTASYAGDANFTPVDSNAVTVTLTMLKAAVTLGNLKQTYTGSPIYATATTNPAGLAVTITYNGSAAAPVHAGNYAVVATINDNWYQGSATGTLVIARANPGSNIIWLKPASISYGAPLSSTQLDATSTLPGTFVYSPAAGTILGAGTHTLTTTFTPTDTTDYTTAPASVSLTVLKATPVVQWGGSFTIVYGQPMPQLGGATANVPGWFSYSPPVGAVLPAGTFSLVAIFTPYDTADYTGGAATATLTVLKSTPRISWITPAPIKHGTPLGPAQLNAAAVDPITFKPLPGTYVYAPKAGTVLSAGTQTLSVTFNPRDTGDYNPAAAWVQITVNP
jgi:hypothetical protein